MRWYINVSVATFSFFFRYVYQEANIHNKRVEGTVSRSRMKQSKAIVHKPWKSNLFSCRMIRSAQRMHKFTHLGVPARPPRTVCAGSFEQKKTRKKHVWSINPFSNISTLIVYRDMRQEIVKKTMILQLLLCVTIDIDILNINID